MTPSLLSQQLDEISAEVAELKKTKPEPLTDTLAHWLTAQYAAAARMASLEAGDGAMPLETLGGLTNHVAALRRGDYHTARLELDHERFEFKRMSKLEIGISELADEIKGNKAAMAIFQDLKRALNEGNAQQLSPAKSNS